MTSERVPVSLTKTLTPEQPLGRALFALLGHQAPLCELKGFLGPDCFIAGPAAQPQGVLFLAYDPLRKDEQQTKLKNARKQLSFPLLVVVFGGDETTASMARGSEPMVTPAKQQWVHIADNGTCSGPASQTPIAIALAQGLTSTDSARLTETAWKRMLETVQRDLRAFEGQRAQIARFQKIRDHQSPRVTVAFLSLMALCFGLEMIFGGSTSTQTLLRLGGLRPELVFEGEVYRLFSVAFLHAGFLHLALNGYVLFVLGRFLEQVVGSWRFAALLGFSILGGSLASLASLELLQTAAFSVGASGGLWGVLAAHAVIAWRRKDLLPEVMVSSAQRAAMINLGLNLFASFQANVDWAAHFGGGLAGAGLFALLLHRGLPSLREQQPGEDPGPVPSPGPFTRLLSVVIVSAMLVSMATAIVRGQPWVLIQPPSYTKVESEKLSLRFDLPTTMTSVSHHVLTTDTPQTQTYGDLFLGPAACTILRVPTEQPEEEVMAELFAALQSSPPQGASIIQPAQRVSWKSSPGMTVRYRFENEANVLIAVKVSDAQLLRTECVVWPTSLQAGWDHVAEDITRSISVRTSAAVPDEG